MPTEKTEAAQLNMVLGALFAVFVTSCSQGTNSSRVSNNTGGPTMPGGVGEEVAEPALVTIAAIGSVDDETMRIIQELLRSWDIETYVAGSIVCDVSVPGEKATEARDLLRNAAVLRKRWVRLKEENGDWIQLGSDE